MKKNNAKAISLSEDGIKLCETFKYEPLVPEVKRIIEEFKSVIVKAKARMEKKTALDVREANE